MYFLRLSLLYFQACILGYVDPTYVKSACLKKKKITPESAQAIRLQTTSETLRTLKQSFGCSNKSVGFTNIRTPRCLSKLNYSRNVLYSHNVGVHYDYNYHLGMVLLAKPVCLGRSETHLELGPKLWPHSKRLLNLTRQVQIGVFFKQ